jgi:DNA-binding NarL/FixJ family response regulator
MRVLVVDDHPLYREGLVMALDTMDQVEVVGQAADGTTAVELAINLAPDVVIMDLHLPGMSGVEATRQLLAGRPDTGVLVLTLLEGDDSLFAARRAGARGYVLKGADRGEIERALRTVAAGEVGFSSGVAASVTAWFRAGGSTAQEPFPELTEREREVLDLVARGLTNTEIAARLVLSDKTVRNHVSNVFAKLHVTNRSGAVARARDAGLGGG